jgi:hypothetical protein
VKDIGDEILIYDSGTLDNVRAKAECFNATVLRGPWESYGATRKKAMLLARNDWILAVDSDEIIDPELRKSITALNLAEKNIMYKFRFKNYFGNKLIKYGEWGNMSEVRLGCKSAAILAEDIVHEKVVVKSGVKVKVLNGFLLHYTARNIKEYSRKMLLYAELSAVKFSGKHKRARGVKLYISPWFSFFRNYFFKLGFLDGWEGLVCASMSSWYTFLKYAYLREEEKQIRSSSLINNLKVINKCEQTVASNTSYQQT